MAGGKCYRKNSEGKLESHPKGTLDRDGQEIKTYSWQDVGGTPVLMRDPEGTLDKYENEVITYVKSKHYKQGAGGQAIKRRPDGDLDKNGVRRSQLTEGLRQTGSSGGNAPQPRRNPSPAGHTLTQDEIDQQDRGEDVPPSYGSHNGIRVPVGGGATGPFRHQENPPSFASQARNYDQSTGRTYQIGQGPPKTISFGRRGATLNESSDEPRDSTESDSGSYPSGASSGNQGVFRYSTDEETRAKEARAKAKGKAVAVEDTKAGSSRKKSSTNEPHRRHKTQVSVSSTDSEPIGAAPAYDASRAIDIPKNSSRRRPEERAKKSEKKTEKKSTQRDGDRERRPSRSRGARDTTGRSHSRGGTTRRRDRSTSGEEPKSGNSNLSDDLYKLSI